MFSVSLSQSVFLSFIFMWTSWWSNQRSEPVHAGCSERSDRTAASGRPQVGLSAAVSVCVGTGPGNRVLVVTRTGSSQARGRKVLQTDRKL